MKKAILEIVKTTKQNTVLGDVAKLDEPEPESEPTSDNEAKEQEQSEEEKEARDRINMLANPEVDGDDTFLHDLPSISNTFLS